MQKFFQSLRQRFTIVVHVESNEDSSIITKEAEVLEIHTNEESSLIQHLRPETPEPPSMKYFDIVAILSTGFSCSCILTTYFILTGPIECQRIEHESEKFYSHKVSKSIALGGFAALAGFGQLIKPLVGVLSDCYVPNKKYPGLYKLGKRIPYILVGTLMMIIGLLGMIWSSTPIHPVPKLFMQNENEYKNEEVYVGVWYQYTIFFFITMLGLNTVYTIMMVLIPDLVPSSQTGLANGTLALLVVTGCLFGFFAFQLIQNNVMGMYKMYISIATLSALLTYIYVSDRENVLKQFEKENIMQNEKTLNCNQGTEQAAGEETTEAIIESCEELSTSSGDRWYPRIHEFLYLIFYEPIRSKSISEMLSAYWIDTNEHQDFFIVTISRFFYYMGVSSQSFFLYYIHDELRKSKVTENPEDAVAFLAIIGQSAGALTCFPVGILSDQYFDGRRKPFVYIACLLLSIGNLALLLCHTMNEMIAVCALLGASNGVYLTMDTSLAVDTLESEEKPKLQDNGITENEQQDNENEGGRKYEHGAAQLLGVWGVFGFVGSALGPLIGGTALLILGHIPIDSSNTQPSSVLDDNNHTDLPSTPFYKIQGYRALFSFSAFYFFCSATTLAFVKKKGV